MKRIVCAADDSEKTKKLAEDLDHFWRDVLAIMDSAADSSSLHNVARLSCLVDDIVKQQASAPTDGATELKVLNTGC